jgi:hypothetical protein
VAGHTGRHHRDALLTQGGPRTTRLVEQPKCNLSLMVEPDQAREIRAAGADAGAAGAARCGSTGPIVLGAGGRYTNSFTLPPACRAPRPGQTGG